MKCNDVERLMAAYLDNEVTPDEREEIQDHLSSCQHCREGLEELTVTQAYLRETFQTATKTVIASSDTWEKIDQRLGADEQPLFFISRWIKGLDCLLTGKLIPHPAVWKVATAATVIVALIIGLVLVIPSDDGSSNIALVSDITENDPQVREALGGGQIAVLDVKIIDGTGCALAGGETGYLVEACIDLETKTVTSLANFGPLFAH